MTELSYRRHGEHVVTRRLDEPSVMFGDLRIDQFGPDCSEPLERFALVGLYEARVACNRLSEPATDRGPVDQRAPVALSRPLFLSTETEASQSADERDLAQCDCC
jgi:hypothetical protein